MQRQKKKKKEGKSKNGTRSCSRATDKDEPHLVAMSTAVACPKERTNLHMLSAAKRSLWVAVITVTISNDRPGMRGRIHPTE